MYPRCALQMIKLKLVVLSNKGIDDWNHPAMEPPCQSGRSCTRFCKSFLHLDSLQVICVKGLARWRSWSRLLPPRQETQETQVRSQGWEDLVEKGGAPGVGNGLQHSCLENSMDRGAWPATVHGIAESNTTEHTLFPGKD